MTSYDNLPENGRLLGAMVAEFVEEAGPGLARWVAGSCRFPNSKVDRAVIETEPFRQWVIEDDFADCARRRRKPLP